MRKVVIILQLCYIIKFSCCLSCNWICYKCNGCLRKPYKYLRKEEKAKEKRKDTPI